MPDPSRPFHSDSEAEPVARPIQVYSWYPAADSCPAPMRWGDVVRWVGVEGGHEALDAARADAGRNEFVAWIGSLEGDTTAARGALEFPLRGCEGVAAAQGRHPLVLLSVGRNDSPAMHTLLGEELGSRGWAVFATGGLGARVRAMEFGAADIEAQLEDLKTVASFAESLDFVDPSRPPVIGYSFGGGVALLYAMADTTVSAVVSLDGSIGFADRVPTYVTLPGWRPQRALAPMLHLRAPDEDREDLSALESIPAPLRIETIPAAVHLDFTDLGPMSAHGLAVPAIGMDDEDGDEIHAAILAATAAFLAEHRPPSVARSGQVD
jgi:dienelactone hydrolase